MTTRIPNYFSKESTPIWKKLWFLLLIACFIGIIIGFYSSNTYIKKSLSHLQKQNEILDIDNKELYSENEKFKSELILLNTELKIKKEATVLLQGQYQEILKDQNFLNSEISFYEKLLNPQEADKGLRVFKTEFSNSQNTLSLTLAQKIERAQEISGKVKVKIEGIVNDKKQDFSPKNNVHDFKFKYFQNISLPISLPEGFKAQNLIVELSPANNKRKKINQIFSWETLIKKEG